MFGGGLFANSRRLREGAGKKVGGAELVERTGCFTPSTATVARLREALKFKRFSHQKRFNSQLEA